MTLENLVQRIRACTACETQLAHGVRPIIRLDAAAKILIIAQAPGRIVHETGIPWNDASGDRLREWFDVDKETFYNPHNFAIVPMGFCYPGKAKSGDLPPRKECQTLWFDQLKPHLQNHQLTLLIGQYAQAYYLAEQHTNVTQNVKNYRQLLDQNLLALPHPSPRNNIWLKRESWFETDVLPELKQRCQQALNSND